MKKNFKSIKGFIDELEWAFVRNEWSPAREVRITRNADTIRVDSEGALISVRIKGDTLECREERETTPAESDKLERWLTGAADRNGYGVSYTARIQEGGAA